MESLGMDEPKIGGLEDDETNAFTIFLKSLPDVGAESDSTETDVGALEGCRLNGLVAGRLLKVIPVLASSKCSA